MQGGAHGLETVSIDLAFIFGCIEPCRLLPAEWLPTSNICSDTDGVLRGNQDYGYISSLGEIRITQSVVIFGSSNARNINKGINICNH